MPKKSNAQKQKEYRERKKLQLGTAQVNDLEAARKRKAWHADLGNSRKRHRTKMRKLRDREVTVQTPQQQMVCTNLT